MNPGPPEQIIEGDDVLQRRFTAPNAQVHDAGGVNHKGQALPISMSLPIDTRPGTVVTKQGHTYREHADGSLSAMDGSRIIRNKDDMKRACEQTGSVHEK